MRRDIFTAEHEDFRLMVREFVAREIVPRYADWERAGEIPRQFFRDLGAIGVMGMAIPEKFGGSGNEDYRYNTILQEEASRALVTMGTVRTQLDVILPYFLAYAHEEQRARWFPGLAGGALLTAIAMTEPGTGSDLAGIRTRAVPLGDHYLLNGAKTFITGGALADLVIVVARTSDPDPADRRAGLTLLVVEDGMPGFAKGRTLDKIGLKVQDTAELSFTDVLVPAANRLGELSGADAAITKLFCTEMQARVVDRCLQLFGGYGYITEFPIARLYADARVTRIYGGTSEVMKSIISKSLGL